MFSESTQKQHLLISGILGAVGGIIGGVGTIIGAFKNITGLSPWATGVLCAAIFLFGVWMLIKWRTRHSRLLKPDALRLDRDNPEHLAGRDEFIKLVLQQCLAKQIVFLEGESGSGKSALVRSGLLPKLKDDKSVLPLLLNESWVDEWSPFRELRKALIESGAVGSGVIAKSADGQLQPAARHISTPAELEQALIRLYAEDRTPLIIFDQFDDYQARNRERFLPNKMWLDPAILRQTNPFWEMVARVLEQDKLHCLFVTRSDTAAGLKSVEFLGSIPVLRLDRVASPDIAALLTSLTDGTSTAPVIADPDAGWTKLRERIISDISEQDIILPQQLNIVLRGIQSLKQLSVKQYERVGGVAGIEAFYVEQQINGTARTLEIDANQVRAMLVALIDHSNPTKTWSRGKEDLLAAAAKGNGQPADDDKLANALVELERGEMVRRLSDRESGRTTYRLDHDYLTRGVSAFERRANRWRYLLEDGAKAFQNAGTLWKKWKALLLPAGMGAGERPVPLWQPPKLRPLEPHSVPCSVVVQPCSIHTSGFGSVWLLDRHVWGELSKGER